eukprot:TRINITY_DN15639_c0_g1_i1.p1 TRINITY_DN15639_c0_g1~~TRINITY_DN15639_c0_g1_i1.p1  ORF type:complete len:858 (-),score=162.36 TRINITY_DN15639_c0_g1_i1:39-2612(-)
MAAKHFAKILFPSTFPIHSKTVVVDLSLTPREFLVKLVSDPLFNNLNIQSEGVRLSPNFKEENKSHSSVSKFKKESSFPYFADDRPFSQYRDILPLTESISFEVTKKVNVKGTILVKIIEAKNLAIADSNGFSDPYCLVFQDKSKKHIFKTKTKYKNLNPNWNEETKYDFNGLDGILVFKVYDWDQIGSDDFLGQVKLSLTDIISNLGERWYYLSPKKNEKKNSVKVQGQLHLSFSLNNVPPTSIPAEPSNPINDAHNTIIYVFENLIKDGNLDGFKKAIQLHVAANTVHPFTKETFLHAAIRENQEQIAKFLLKQKINLSAKDKESFTPLHCALINNQIEIAENLISKGSNVNATNSQGTTPLMYAVRLNTDDVSSYLGLLRGLIKRGANIDHAATLTGDTALHAATMTRRVMGVVYLLDQGANPNIVNVTGYTPLHIACSEAITPLVLALLLNQNKAINPSLSTDIGTCMDLAEKYEHPEIIQILLSWSKNQISELPCDEIDPYLQKLEEFKNKKKALFKNRDRSKGEASLGSASWDPTTSATTSLTMSASFGESSRLTMKNSQMIEFQNNSLSDPSSHFKLDKLLGEGAYGQVYLGVHKELNFPVAIKMMQVTDKTRKGLSNEIKIQCLQKHNNIVHCYDIYYTGEKVCIVMELCSMGSILDFRSVLKRNFTEIEVCAIVENVLGGLVHLHKNMIVHRDLKGQNILVTSDGKPKLADFGVSSQLDKDQQACRTVIGTPLFMSPEVLMGQPYDYSTDIWSLGITILQLIDQLPHVGLPPVAAIFKIITEPPPTLQTPENYTQNFGQFIATCLQSDCRLRPTSQDLIEHAMIKESPSLSHVVMQSMISDREKNILN